MMQYLILHKVRGEPAFDVAEKTLIGDEEGWVLCTCGHRAYPYRWWTLEDLADISDINYHGCHNRPATMTNLPDYWPDHYEAKPEAKVKLNVLELVSQMLPKLKRRL